MVSSVPIKYKWFFNISIWLIYGTLVGITTLGNKVDLGVMAMKVYFLLPCSSEREPHYLMEFSFIPMSPFYRGGS